MPKISVIVPVYKVEQYLDRCVNSILNQTFTDFELILVDDGSPDNSGKMCDEYALQDSRVKVIHKENGGLSDARNVALDMIFNKSDSEWLTFIDSDDWVHSRYLELTYNFAKREKLSVVTVESLITDKFVEDKKVADDVYTIEEISNAFRNPKLDAESACGPIFLKSLYEDIRFPKGKLHEDRFTTYKALFKCDKVGVINSQMYYYFMNSDSIIHQKWTPRKMDDLEAAEQQMAFFDKIKNEEVYRYIVGDYMKLCIYGIRELSKSGEYPEYKKLLRKNLRKTLHREKNRIGFTVNKNFEIYKYAYPNFAKIYRRIFGNRIAK